MGNGLHADFLRSSAATLLALTAAASATKVVFAQFSFEVLELQLHLLKRAAGAFGASTRLLALELDDLQAELGDYRLGGALAGMRVGEPPPAGSLPRAAPSALQRRPEGANRRLPWG